MNDIKNVLIDRCGFDLEEADFQISTLKRLEKDNGSVVNFFFEKTAYHENIAIIFLNNSTRRIFF